MDRGHPEERLDLRRADRVRGSVALALDQGGPSGWIYRGDVDAVVAGLADDSEVPIAKATKDGRGGSLEFARRQGQHLAQGADLDRRRTQVALKGDPLTPIANLCRSPHPRCVAMRAAA